MSQSSSPNHPSAEPIAVVGMACMFPKAADLKGFWHVLRVGKDAIGDIPDTHWRPEDYFDADPRSPDRTYCRKGGFLDPYPFDPTEFSLPPTVLEATDTSQLLGLVVAKAALEDAGYTSERVFERSRTSVILGVTGALELVVPLGARLGHPMWRRALLESGVDAETAEAVVSRIADDYVPWQENSFPGLLGNVVAGRIANRLDLHGTNCAVDAACGSTLAAAHVATMELEAGRADMVVTGGVDTFNDIFMYMCFSKTPALSAQGRICPFSADGDGTLLGEGIGMVVLKRLSEAERDSDRIYCIIRGMGTSSDGGQKAVYAPYSPGQARALRRAYERTGVDPSTVELVEAHGTGTKVGDVVEFEALKEVYGASPQGHPHCALGSVKSQIGHTKAAAGAAGLIKTALALHHKVLPPTINIERPNPKLGIEESPFYLNTRARPWRSCEDHPRRAALSAFGFGGSNYHMVLEEYGGKRRDTAWDGSVEILAYSAATREQLIAALPDRCELSELAWESRQRFSTGDAARLVLVARPDDVEQLLAEARRRLASGESPQGPDIFYAEGPAAGTLALMFPGQGSQYLEMGRELACVFPEMLEALEAVDPRVVDRVYPPPSFSTETRELQARELTRTDVAQPALGAVSRGMLGILERFRLKPAMAFGHSYGELCALFAAGRLDPGGLVRLSALRGELMAAQGDNLGTMLAVTAPLAEIEEVLKERHLEVVLANRNSPTQAVLSGTVEAIGETAAVMAHKGFSATRLQVGAAFHSPLVAGAAAPFREGMNGQPFPTGAIPVFSNTTGDLYPEDPEQAADLLANQLAREVDFVGLVDRAYAEGARVFLEVGPRRVLSRLVEAILRGRPHHVVALDASAGKGSSLVDLARALARLAVLGMEVDLGNWECQPPKRRKRLMEVKLVGANYRSPRQTKPEVPARPPAPSKAIEPEVPSLQSAPAVPEPAPVTMPRAVDNALFQQAFQGVSSSLAAMQTLAQQTAEAHQRFLEGQQAAQQTFDRLVAEQQRLVNRVLGLGGSMPAPAPAPERLPVAPLTPAPVALTPEPVPAPVVPAPAAPPPPSSPPPAAAPPDGVSQRLLEVVAEKTGYPAEMLSLDMDLEADLGIDSIKRVEILAAVEEAVPGLAGVEPEMMGSLRTLAQVAEALGVPAPAAVPAAPAAAPSSGVSQRLLEVVAEKTGYPVEMLNLEMDLEADLGIDSIKRVEILAAVEEALPSVVAVDPDKMGSLRTLAQVVDALGGGAPAQAAAAPPVGVSQRLLEVVAEKTGYPAEMLQLEMDLEADLGIDSIKRVEILAALEEAVPGLATVGPEKMGSLRTLAQVVEAVEAPAAAAPARISTNGTASHADPAADHLERRLLRAVPAGPAGAQGLPLAQGATVLVAEDRPGLGVALVEVLATRGVRASLVQGEHVETPPDGLILVGNGGSWEEGERFLTRAFELVQQAAVGLREAAGGSGALLATVTRMDGAFGLEGGAFDPLMGGLAGLPKTVSHEWPGVSCRAIDLHPDMDAAAVAAELASGGPLEVGLGPSGRKRLETVVAPATTAQPVLGRGDLVLVTGGARGVTARCAIELARAFGPRLVLVGRTPAPVAEPDWLAGLTEQASLKKAILQHELGNKATPAELEQAFQRWMANREVAATLKSVEQAGSPVEYRRLDVRDAVAVRDLAQQLQAAHGPVRGLIHAAGVLFDRKIEDKRPEQFEAVFGTKVGGLHSLLQAVDPGELRSLVLFSSVTARYGRPGQVDYCMANEVLNKVAQVHARRYRGCRVVALDWGPWEGGMVTPALSREFRRLGVGLIPLDAGARALVDELRCGGPEVEVLIGDGFPAPHETGPLNGQNGKSALLPVLQKKLSTRAFPFLSSHVIGGRPVLPMALMLEWFGHAALHDNVGFRFFGVEGLKVFKGLTLETAEPTVSVLVGPPSERSDGLQAVEVELRDLARHTLHARATVLLAAEVPPAPSVSQPDGLTSGEFPYQREQIYAELLFHGSHFHGIKRVDGISSAGLVAELQTAPRPSEWIADPIRSEWLTDPLAIDGVLQLGVLWCIHQLGKPSLPDAGASYRQYRRKFPRKGIKALLVVTEGSGHRLCADAFLLDGKGKLVASYHGLEWTADSSLRQAFERKELAASMGRPETGD